MLTTFENETVNINDVFQLLLYPQIRILIGVVIFAIIASLVIKNIWPQFKSKIIENFVTIIWLLFKIFIYGCLAAVVFFFDFTANQFIWWHIPERMLLSTVFVGLLAIYEMVSNIIELIKSAIHINDP